MRTRPATDGSGRRRRAGPGGAEVGRRAPRRLLPLCGRDGHDRDRAGGIRDPARGARPVRRPADVAPPGEARALRGDPDDDARGRAAGGRWMMRLARLLVVAVGLSAAVASAQWGGRDWQDLSPDDRRRAWENY